MERNKLLRADYLDILFDGRNKAYGGYELRRKYTARTRRATLSVIAGVALAAAVPFIADAIGDKTPVMTPMEQVVHIARIEPPTETIPPPVHVDAPPPSIATIANPEIRLVPDELATDVPPTVDELRNARISLETHEGPSGNADLIPSGSVGGGASTVDAEPPSDKIEIYVDVPPVFNGDLKQYLESHLRYPDVARENNQEGTVGIQFVVDEEGRISTAEVVKHVSPALDAEALRVVKTMLPWKPGKLNGKAVKTYFKLPITFTLD